MNKQIKYYKVIKACAGLIIGDVVVKTKGESGAKSAYYKLTDDSTQKVAYCICKKSLLKLDYTKTQGVSGDNILIIKPTMTSGLYKLGDVLAVNSTDSEGVYVSFRGSKKWVAPHEYIVVSNWDEQTVGEDQQVYVESHEGFKVGDMVTVVSGGKRKGAFGIVHGFSYMNSPLIKFSKAGDELHTGNIFLKSIYKPLSSNSGWYIQTEDLRHFNENSERAKRVRAAQDTANVEFDKELAALKTL